MAKELTDQDFIRLYQLHGPSLLAQELGVDRRTMQRRRAKIEKELGVSILPPLLHKEERAARLEIEVPNGLVMIASDAHYWPGKPSTGHRAFVKIAKMLKPDYIIMNGDVLDGASISRFPPIGWEGAPSVKEEMDVAQERLSEIKKASPKSKRIWTLGNHDARFETRLASVAPEFKDVHGIHLKDHFPDWTPSFSVDINQKVMVKHRFKGGTHAAWTNVLYSGRSIITGHLHSLQVKPYTDYNGTRFGVDGGMLGTPLGPQFTGYTEDNPLNWREGFVILRFKDWHMRWPEIVNVVSPGVVEFRGQDMEV